MTWCGLVREDTLTFWILAVLIFMFGLLLMAIALLGANRSPVPKIKHPGLFWWPSLGMFVIAILVAMVPRVIAYGKCETAGDVLGGKEAIEEYNKNVQAEYDNCVSSQLFTVKDALVKAGGTKADIEKASTAAVPDAEFTCSNMAVGACVSKCYMPTPVNKE